MYSGVLQQSHSEERSRRRETEARSALWAAVHRCSKVQRSAARIRVCPVKLFQPRHVIDVISLHPALAVTGMKKFLDPGQGSP